MLFKNRSDAGEQLAKKLTGYKNCVILALARGGLEIALPIAKKLHAKMDVIVVKKITTPQDPEVALGAVTASGAAVYNEAYLEQLGLTDEEISILEKEAMNEAVRREELYKTKTTMLMGKTVILIDDGMATGYTMLAAIKSVRKSKPKNIIVAVPVAARGAFEIIKKECDVVCLHVSDALLAVGAFYRDFPQLTDEEVIELLEKAHEKE